VRLRGRSRAAGLRGVATRWMRSSPTTRWSVQASMDSGRRDQGGGIDAEVAQHALPHRLGLHLEDDARREWRDEPRALRQLVRADCPQPAYPRKDESVGGVASTRFSVSSEPAKCSSSETSVTSSRSAPVASPRSTQPVLGCTGPPQFTSVAGAPCHSMPREAHRLSAAISERRFSSSPNVNCASW
jgi:hypothetical protein